MAGEDVMDLIPVGLHVLVVDDNPTCLKILQRLLWLCQYIVTITTEARLALEILRADKDKYDIVITDVHMPEMNGLVLLEHIGLELDIPVIMLSANDDPRLVMKGVKHGAVDYMLKPVRLEDLKHIWQHVVRRKQLNKRKGKEPMIDEDDAEVDPAFLEEADSVIPDEASTKKRKDKEVREDDDDDGQGSEEERGSESTDVASQKKPRIVWSPELHQKFVDAVDQLGADRAFPKKILDVMNVEGLTRENVASHLQKYRLYLRRMSTSGQFGDPVLPFGLLGGGSMYNPFTRMLGHLNPAAGYHGVLSQRASNLVTGLAQSYNVGRFQNPIAPLGMSPFSLQSREGLGNQAPVVVAPSDVRPQGIAPQLQDYVRPQGIAPQLQDYGRPQGIAPQLQDYVRPQGIAPQLQDYVRPQAIAPQLQDYTQRLEHWQSEITARVPAQQNQATNNQISPSSYNGADLSYLQSALARHSLDPPPATHGGPNAGVIGGQVPQLGAQNVSYNVNMEPPRWQEPPIVSPNITSVFNSEPLAPAIASSSRVFGADSPSPFINNLLDMQGSEVDVFENYLLDDPDLDFDFDQNNGGSLEDIVKGFPK